MKKLVFLAVLLFPAVSSAGELRGFAGPNIVFAGKATGLPGTSLRLINPGLDMGLDYFWSQWGFGTLVSLAATQFAKSDLNIAGVTVGPRFELPLWDLVLRASAGIGNYNFSGALVNENSLGFNAGASVNLALSEKTFASLGADFHYATDTGGKDDLVLVTFGPKVGFKF